MHTLVIMDTKTKNNKGKKYSLLMCFKPVDAKDKSFKPKRRKDKTTNPVAAYVRVEEEKGHVVSPELSSEFTAADNGGGGSSGRRGNSKHRWQALKAVLNLTSLMKKINSKRKSSKDHLSRSNTSLENGTEMTNQKQYGVQGKISETQSKSTYRTDSNISSSYGAPSAFTSSPSLTSSTSSRSDQTWGSLDSSDENGTDVTNQKQYGVEDKRRKACYGSYTSMCMFFISLLVLILWGRFFATLYTTIWFYVLPPRPTRPCNDINLGGESQFESVRYKKMKKLP